MSLLGDGVQCQARCSCKARSPLSDRGGAMAWFYAHQQEINKIRAHLGSRTPTLANQRDWFRHKADDPDTPYEDRQLWRQLADEVDRFVTTRVSHPGDSQLSLF
jgi:hypothetical protein